MIVVCPWCQQQGLPSVQREVEPYADTGLTRSICRLHAEELRARLRAAAGQVRAQIQQDREEGRTP